MLSIQMNEMKKQFAEDNSTEMETRLTTMCVCVQCHHSAARHPVPAVGAAVSQQMILHTFSQTRSSNSSHCVSAKII